MKIKELQDKMLRTYYLEYNETSEGGDVCKGQEGQPWPSYEDTTIEFTPVALHCSRATLPGWLTEEFDVDFKLKHSGFILIACYSSGDTFQYTSGHYAFLGLFRSRQEAEKFSESVDKLRWNDYFGGFEDFEIYEVPVR